MFQDQIKITPREFEIAVKGILDAAAGSLIEYKSDHLHSLSAADGEYVIDVTARFEALGATFLVIVECKHHARKIERQDVQVLHAKVQSLGAQKGMLFSTAGFQSGAIEYASAHGVALVKIEHGEASYMTKSLGPKPSPPPWANIPKYVGWWCHGRSVSIMSEDHTEYTRLALGLQSAEP